MKTTRLTHGKGVTKRERRNNSRVSGSMREFVKRSFLRLSQNRVPLSMAVSLVSNPPWLWPITTMRCNAGALPVRVELVQDILQRLP